MYGKEAELPVARGQERGWWGDLGGQGKRVKRGDDGGEFVGVCRCRRVVTGSCVGVDGW